MKRSIHSTSRGSPQLLLPLGTPGPKPRLATAWRDDSPFDPAPRWEPVDPPPAPLPRLLTPPPAPAPQPRIERTPIARDQVLRLGNELRVLIGGRVRVHVHDNRSTMVSFRRESDSMHLRLHHMFLTAGPEVVRALADYARARSARAGRLLDQFVRQHREHIRPHVTERTRTRTLRTRGVVHELQAMYDQLNARYFNGGISARIGWGRGTAERRRRSIRMGAYYPETRTILIHPALDRIEVPDYFVSMVIFHEMLHQAVPQKRADTGRRSVHTSEFRRREREFHDFERAHAWERRHLSILLRAPRPSR